MCTHPAAFHQGVAQLRLESPESADRKLGALLDMLDQSGDEDAIERLLFEMVTEDPAGSVEYRIAGHLIALLFPAEAKR